MLNAGAEQHEDDREEWEPVGQGCRERRASPPPQERRRPEQTEQHGWDDVVCSRVPGGWSSFRRVRRRRPGSRRGSTTSAGTGAPRRGRPRAWTARWRRPGSRASRRDRWGPRRAAARSGDGGPERSGAVPPAGAPAPGGAATRARAGCRCRRSRDQPCVSGGTSPPLRSARRPGATTARGRGGPGRRGRPRRWSDQAPSHLPACVGHAIRASTPPRRHVMIATAAAVSGRSVRTELPKAPAMLATIAGW